jgi:hypothetical protein
MLPGYNVLDVEGGVGTPFAADGITRVGCCHVPGLSRQTRSSGGINRLARFRLPVGQQIAHIDLRFQFGLFVVGQLTLIGIRRTTSSIGLPSNITIRRLLRSSPTGLSPVEKTTHCKRHHPNGALWPIRVNPTPLAPSPPAQ